MDSDRAGFAETTSFLHYFSTLPDHRQAGKVDYPLPEVLVCTKNLNADVVMMKSAKDGV